MIYGKSRNVIVIKNLDSSYVEQAILILKKDVDDKEYFGSNDNIVVEAQKIIENYIKRGPEGVQALRKERYRMINAVLIKLFLSLSFLLAVAACVFFVFK